MTAEVNERGNDLILKAQAGDKQAMDDMVRDNLALVKYVVRRYMNRGREYDDLFQLGCLGLVKSIRNFNTEYGVRFSTYAVPVIMGEIRRFLRDDGLIRVSRSIKENAQRVFQFAEEYEDVNGREPTMDEISSELGLSREDALLAINSAKPVRSLSEPIGEDGALTLQDTVGEDKSGEVDQRIELERMLNTLPEFEREILIKRYYQHQTQNQIAMDLSMTQVQVSRLESKILRRLRESIRAV